jgi:hypothetical protein
MNVINNIYIIEASYNNLTAYFAIPIKEKEYSFIDGATSVNYLPDGTIDYLKTPYILYKYREGSSPLDTTKDSYYVVQKIDEKNYYKYYV